MVHTLLALSAFNAFVEASFVFGAVLSLAPLVSVVLISALLSFAFLTALMLVSALLEIQAAQKKRQSCFERRNCTLLRRYR